MKLLDFSNKTESSWHEKNGFKNFTHSRVPWNKMNIFLVFCVNILRNLMNTRSYSLHSLIFNQIFMYLFKKMWKKSDRFCWKWKENLQWNVIDIWWFYGAIRMVYLICLSSGVSRIFWGRGGVLSHDLFGISIQIMNFYRLKVVFQEILGNWSKKHWMHPFVLGVVHLWLSSFIKDGVWDFETFLPK